LRSCQFRVANWGYVSFLGSIEKHAERLHGHLTGPLSGEGRLHIVAHSMGSIVVRAALSMGEIPNLRRVVLIAPPNTGTPLARFASSLCGGLCRPLSELSNRTGSYVNNLPNLDSLDCGVIAGRFDLLVPESNTHIQGERGHIILNATHNTLLFSRTTATLTKAFLTTGSFERSR
jgi:hypothetical protein